MTKSEELKKLYEEYNREFQGQEIVVGDGSTNSRLLLVGEAPGRDEVKIGKPFVGAAGKNLAEFLEVLKLDRKSIYITNAVKYRLSKVNEKTGMVVNRPATAKDIEGSRKYLLEEIRILEPQYIVTLGNVPLKSVTGESDISVGQVHGELKEIEIQDKAFLLFPLYHPASIIYNRSLKDIYLNDIGKLGQIIS